MAPRALLFALLVACDAPTPSEPAPELVVSSWAAPACTNDDAVPRWSVTRLAHPAADDHRFAGGGIAAFDADLDGHLDLLLPGPSQARLLLGPHFTTERPLPRTEGLMTGVAVADIDADGDGDAFVARFGGPDQLWRNDDGVFVGLDVGVDGGNGHSQSAAWADLNGDGRLDLLVAGHGVAGVDDGQVVLDGPGDPTRLHLGRADGGFDDATARLPEALHEAYTFVAAPIDLDGDGTLDVYAANDYPAWRTQMAAWNDGETFTLDDGRSGLSPYGAGMGLGIGDINGDDIDDLMMPVWNRLIVLVSSAGGWVEASDATGLVLPPRAESWVGWGGELVDLDLDGRLDAIAAFGHLDALAARTVGGASSANALEQPTLTWLGSDEGFTLTDLGMPRTGVHRGFVAADLNEDGVLDLAMPDLSGGVDLVMSSCSPRAWLSIRLRDETSANRDAIGAVIRVEGPHGEQRRTIRAGGTSLQSSGPPVAHVGLGDLNEARVVVTWPDGRVDDLGPIAGRQTVLVTRR